MLVFVDGGHILVAMMLLKNGANVKAKTNDGVTTPLLIATVKGHARMIEFLKANGGI